MYVKPKLGSRLPKRNARSPYDMESLPGHDEDEADAFVCMLMMDGFARINIRRSNGLGCRLNTLILCIELFDTAWFCGRLWVHLHCCYDLQADPMITLSALALPQTHAYIAFGWLDGKGC